MMGVNYLVSWYNNDRFLIHAEDSKHFLLHIWFYSKVYTKLLFFKKGMKWNLKWFNVEHQSWNCLSEYESRPSINDSLKCKSRHLTDDKLIELFLIPLLVVYSQKIQTLYKETSNLNKVILHKSRHIYLLMVNWI